MNDILKININEELTELGNYNTGILLDSVETPITKKMTKSFKRFCLEQLLYESPSRQDNWANMPLENTAYNSEEAQLFISGQKGEKIYTISYKNMKFDIYFYDFSGKLNYICILHGIIQILGWIRINKIGKYYATNGLWNYSETAKGLVFYYFTNYLLPEYRMLLSDTMTTPSGEIFWKKVLQWGLTNNKECGIFIEENTTLKTPEQFIPLKNIQDFEEAWNSKGFLKRIYIKE